MQAADTVFELLWRHAAGHRDQRNLALHCIAVPLLVFGSGVLLARARFEINEIHFSAAWLVVALSAFWYLTRRGAFTLSLATTAAMAALTCGAHSVAESHWLAWGLGSVCTGVAARFLGRCYEGRCHAAGERANLLTGILFVTAEALFALGWNKTLMLEIERRAGPTYLRDLAHPA